MKDEKIKTAPQAVFSEYRSGTDFKAGIGNRGIFEQSKMNERFYTGDHWYGVKCGNDRPLVRRNIIRRIADYKLSSIGAAPVAVNFSAEGIADNTFGEDERKVALNTALGGGDITGGSNTADGLEVATVMQVLTDYGKTSMERLGFDGLIAQVLKNAYISGTGILYTYWDETVKTGLYADVARSTPITGDIACEVIDIENVVFGDPNCDDVQRQPYIIISQRLCCAEVRREARRNRRSADEIEQIKPDGADSMYLNAGTRGEDEPADSMRVTVLTKFYKQWDEDGRDFRVMCTRVTEKAVVRAPFDIGIHLYPVAKLVWDARRSSAYGDSEITYLIPNQIAINRALSAEVWGCMLTGMPIMLQNGDIITEPVTNDPGQIIKVYSAEGDIAGALRYVQPPSFAGQMLTSINDLASSTLSDSGANDAALGNIRPDNAAAIIQMRHAALQPMQLKQNQYYAFFENVMRIWAQFWLNLYGDRSLKVSTAGGTAYVPFRAARYRDLLISARVDVGASTLWSTSLVVSTLDALLSAGVITPVQYLERIPGGFIPDKTGLIEDLKAQQQAAQMQAETSDEAILQQLAAEDPELYARFTQLPPEKQQEMLARMRGDSMPNGPSEKQVPTNEISGEEVGDL